MIARELLDLKKAVPFEAFRLVTSDGSVFEVNSPEWLVVGTKTTHLYMPSLDEPELADHLIRIANDQITHTFPVRAGLERERQPAAPNQ